MPFAVPEQAKELNTTLQFAQLATFFGRSQQASVNDDLKTLQNNYKDITTLNNMKKPPGLKIEIQSSGNSFRSCRQLQTVPIGESHRSNLSHQKQTAMPSSPFGSVKMFYRTVSATVKLRVGDTVLLKRDWKHTKPLITQHTTRSRLWKAPWSQRLMVIELLPETCHTTRKPNSWKTYETVRKWLESQSEDILPPVQGDLNYAFDNDQ